MATDDDGNASSSDTHGPLVGDNEHTSKKIEEVAVVNGIAEGSPNLGPEPVKDVLPSAAESSRGPSVSPVTDQQSDVGSVHSMPAVRITESPVPMIYEPQPSLPSPSPTALSHRPPPSPSRSQTLQEPTPHNQLQQRRAGRRSTIEGRSANRLSGFFNHLMHRRDGGSTASRDRDLAPDSSTPAPPSQVNSARVSESASRPPSPPAARPVTPPPSLPPPTLYELGLSLSVLTPDLSPSHFTSPPTSGAFLAPHFLLLCHAQGLDVLPLVSPPAPQPYALVRRVSFKSVVVMEQRGVLVAIAGRRDGVRVYALEEVKKAIEWRIDVEVKRERERLRRESTKKPSTIRSLEAVEVRGDTLRKASLSTPPPGEIDNSRNHLLRKSSYGPIHLPPSPPPVALVPRPPLSRPPMRKPRSASVQVPTQPQVAPPGHPPPYMNVEESDSQLHLRNQRSTVSLRARSRARSGSVSNVLSAVPRLRESSRSREDETKADWAESSDDEAINIVAAGSSGSQALDERTSASLSANRVSASIPLPPLVSQAASTTHTRTRSGTLRRGRPSNLDLTIVTSTPNVPPPEPSPVPTLINLRQSLAHPPTTHDRESLPEANTPLPEDDDDEADGRISLAQALMESRLPELPPPGSTQAQDPILLSPDVVSPSSGGALGSRSSSRQGTDQTGSRRRRRRWSVLLTSSPTQTQEPIPEPPMTAPAADRSPHRFTRSHSFRSNHSQPGSIASTFDGPPPSAFIPPSTYSLPTESVPTPTPRSSRFLPRIISNAFHGRRSDDRPPLPTHLSDSEASKINSNSMAVQSPPPKLEYVKLPGTKNALLIKAVETAKKSFLAILCGDNGEKVELFAGTYRTALGLSRTFILPDSPRSLELQLQGDDLVEVFLVFAQNVFGLEPATVRVREVRIGRAERRAARRRAREARAGDSPSGQNDAEAAEDDTNMNVNIGVTVSVGASVVATGDGPNTQPPTPTLVATDHPSSQLDRSTTPTETLPTTSIAHPEELLALASSQTGPYTTFQQLTFSPKFPLASIADEYIIPPTYPSFVEYRSEHEPDAEGSASSSIEVPIAQFSPPGLPIPTATAPAKWLYRDPKGVVHGPWKASLMQAWYKDGLLPPDLPVRREEDDDFTLLKELRLQCVDPTQPFRSPPIRASSTSTPSEVYKPLLAPISLLAQPRHFGPPALFFSSRGGHSTAIVDSRGRSVLKGRFFWSRDGDNSDEFKVPSNMGDIRRLEAFDVEDGSVLIAMRQGGLEAVDLRDALLKPADESRTVLPHYNPPSNNTNRRPPFVWKIGTPIQASPAPLSALTNKTKGGSFSNLTSKRPGTGSSGKGNGKADAANDGDLDPQDEVFYIGRREDELYVCERNAGSFRVLKLAPNATC